MAKGPCREPLGEVLMGLLVEILPDQPLCVICRSCSLLTSAERVVHEIAMATIGNAGSTAAILITFPLERILSRVCSVGCKGSLVCGMCMPVHATLCHGEQLSEHACEPKARSFVLPFSQSTSPRDDYR